MEKLFEYLPSIMDAAKDNTFGLFALVALAIATVVVLLMRKSPIWARLASVVLVIASCLSLALAALIEYAPDKRICEVTFERTNLLGASLGGERFSNTNPATNREHCREKCIKDKRCVAWVFNKARPEPHPHCWIYDHVTNGEASESTTTGIRLSCSYVSK